jgi:hypothetical protein
MDITESWASPDIEAAYHQTGRLLAEQRRMAQSPDELRSIMRGQEFALKEMAQIYATCCLPEVTMSEIEWSRIKHHFPNTEGERG